MLELVMMIAGVIFMARVAAMENRSGFAWGGMTLLLCLGSAFVIPLPLIRIVIVIVAMLIVLTVWNILGKSRRNV